MTETLKYSITETGANTFTENEKSLEQEIGNKRRGKKGSSTKVMWVKSITIDWGLSRAMGDGDTYEVQITTNSEADIVSISDKDLFWKASEKVFGAVAAGAGLAQAVERFPVDRLYIKKDMFIGINSESDAGVLTYGIEIDFDYVYINDKLKDLPFNSSLEDITNDFEEGVSKLCHIRNLTVVGSRITDLMHENVVEVMERLEEGALMPRVLDILGAECIKN